MKFYAGIGSRETPYDVRCQMAIIGTELRKKGYTLRTGGADGADAAFLGVARGKVELYLPWPGFNGHSGHSKGIVCGNDLTLRVIAKSHHPRWGALSDGAKKLMTRNVAQVLGLHPLISEMSEFVICWTPEGKGGGGTGQAIRIARAYDVPVYDLALEANREKVKELIK